MSGETAWRSGDAWAEAGIRGAVVVAHGGKSVSTALTSPLELAVLRMAPLANAIRRALRGCGVAVCQPRFEVQGWNGELASPVADLGRVLDEIGPRYGGIPVVLIGHSMGARAAFRVAAHPAVTAVAGLAPWLPPGEPVDQLAGRRVLLAHGTADRVTPPEETWAYAERARSVTNVAVIEVRGGEHTMLWRAPLWHRLAVEFSRLSLGLPAGAGEVTKSFQETTTGEPRTMV
jgi:pimeloyl-ACP methyl ester carboxylesterase